jgi:hypothetical protein
MALDLTELAVISKEVIEPSVADLVEREPVLYNKIPKGGEINSRGVFLYAKVEPNPSIGWFAEGGAYATGNNGKRVKMNATLSRVNITSKLTRDALEGADKEAIVNAITEEVGDSTKSILREISQQLYGDGSGVKGIVASVSGTDVTFRAGVSDLSPDNVNYANSFGTQQLLKQGIYNFIGGSVRGGVAAIGQVLDTGGTTDFTLSSITSGTIGAFAAVPTDDAMADGDMIVSSGSYNQAIKGLDYHIDSGTGTYQNVSRSTYPALRCYVLNAANGALTVAMLYKIIFNARYARRNNLTTGNYIILSAPTQVQAYALLGNVSTAGVSGNTTLDAMPDGGKLDFGWKTFAFAGLTWMEDIDCPPHKIFLIDLSQFKIHEYKPLSKVFEGSGFAPVPNFTSAGVGSYSDNVLYTLTWKGQLVSKDPQMAGAKINNATATGLANGTGGFALS